MTTQARAWLVAQLLDGAVLELLGAGGDSYAGGGYQPHRLEPLDVTTSEDGTEADVDYTWTLNAAAEPAHGYRLMRGSLLVDQELFDKPLAVPVAGTEIRGRCTVKVG
jgi:hypothetical protein